MPTVNKVTTEYDSGAFVVEVFVGGKRRWIKTYFNTGLKKTDANEHEKLKAEQEEVAQQMKKEVA